MKPLLLLTLCFSAVCVFAQNPEVKKSLQLPQRFEVFINGEKKKLPTDSSVAVVPGKQLFLFNAKPGTYSLPVDNMPCIVPNITGIAHMPNAFRGTVQVPYAGRIPNAAKPHITTNVFVPRLKQVTPPAAK